MYRLLYLLIPFLLFSCKSKQKLERFPLSSFQQIIFLDSLQATKAVVVDQTEGFFEQVRVLDMSIQMRREYHPSNPRDSILKDYKQFLQADVTNFSNEEKQFLQKVFKEVFELSEQLSSSIFPKEIKLIKSQGKPYGPSVYYTRDDCIVIPQYVLDTPDYSSFLSVMLHELFHIYSRYHPDKKALLYALIGFKPIPNPEAIKMNEALDNRVLLNPDGINYAWVINLKMDDNSQVQAIPLIVSNKDRFESASPDFFNYLSFHLYEVKPPYVNLIQILTDNEGMPTKDLIRTSNFWRQIRDNTQYIIHPDEIMADNFMHLLLSKRPGGSIEKFSREGQELIKQIEELLKDQ